LELLIVIHHPGKAIRPPAAIVTELAQVYDVAYSGTSIRKVMELPHVLVVLLSWGQASLGWTRWHEDETGILATAGLPLLHCPPGGSSTMLDAARLANFVSQASERSNCDLAYCGGYFAAAHVNKSGVVRLANNYLGEVPLYRASHRGVTVWSNKSAAAGMLAGVEPKLDGQGVREFILLSHCLEGRTLFADVEIEPPGIFIEMNADRYTRRSYIDLPSIYFAHDRPDDGTGDEVVSAMGPLIEALRKSSQEVRIHLTGGQDSRAVAAICRHHGFRPLCLTHGTPNEEVPSAKRLAKHLGMRYRTVNGTLPTWETFIELARQSMWQSDGLMSLKYLAGKYDMTYIRDEGYLPVEGLGGEYGRAYYFGTKDSFAKTSSGRFDPILKKAMGGREEWWPCVEDIQSVRQTIQSILAHAGDDGLNPFQVTTWFYVNQKMRHWATARRNMGWCWIIDPLQMPCWTYRGMSADPQRQRDDGLIREVIDAAWPGTTGIPTVPQLAYAARYRRVASNRIVRNAMKVYDCFSPPMPMPIQSQVFQQMRQHYTHQIKQAGDALSDIVTTTVIDSWLDREPWSYLQTELFWHTLTVAVWCETFLSHPRRIGPAIDEA